MYCEVSISHLQNAVGVDVEGDLNLRDAARRRRYARQLELAQDVVVLGHAALALKHLLSLFRRRGHKRQ